MFTPTDEQFMRQALALAEEGRFWTRPNPSVGCVLVRDDIVLGGGFTQPVGGNHAEVEALRAAGDAQGATAYVTLEPCAHYGRTPPCADALIAAGVARVVIAVEDPHPKVAGRGADKLRAAGIVTDVGLLAAEAEQQLAGFLWRMRRGWGRVRLKVASSLDGRIAMASGESQWITGAAARADVQLWRAASCAVLTGAGTVLADNCRLAVRPEQLPLTGERLQRATHSQPLRVVLDSHQRTPLDAAVYDSSSPAVRLVVDSPRAPIDRQLPAGPAGRLALSEVMAWLGAQGCNEILVEAGPVLSGALLDAGLVDELLLYVAPRLLGRTARPLAALERDRLDDALGLAFVSVTPIGDDLRIIATPKK